MSISSILILLLLLLFQPTKMFSLNSFFLPLKTQQIAPKSLPPNKLLFHHNVTLTVTLAVGSPPQNVSMVLDTGSELSWLNCGNLTASNFNPKISTSYVPIPCKSLTCRTRTVDLSSPAFCQPQTQLCHVALAYADASTSEGDLAFEVLRIAMSPPVKAIFGCMGSGFSSVADDPVTAGLLGMNRGSLSLATQMGMNRFSYCISDHDNTGVLLLGDAILPFTLSLNYTPMVRMTLPLPYFDRVAYSVELQGIRVGSTTLPIPKSVLSPDHTGAGQTMVDSGTRFSFLMGPAYQVLKTEFLRQTNTILKVLSDPNFVFEGAFDTCFLIPVTRTELPALPPVTVVFRGAEVSVTGGRLLYRLPGVQRGGDGVWCFTFGNSDLVPLQAYIIGHHHQQNVWVEYDLQNGRVGFAPVQCADAGRKLALLH